MKSEFTQCRCGTSIPKTWPKCQSCLDQSDQDSLEGGIHRRMERAQLIRVRRGMDFEVTPVLDADTHKALLKGIARVSQQEKLQHLRKQMEAHQHISVLYQNSQARIMDMLDQQQQSD